MCFVVVVVVVVVIIALLFPHVRSAFIPTFVSHLYKCRQVTTFAAEQVVLTCLVVCEEGEQCMGEGEQCGCEGEQCVGGGEQCG